MASMEQYIKDGNIENATTIAMMVESESDLDHLTHLDPGSIAYTAGFQRIWQFSSDGTWVSVA